METKPGARQYADIVLTTVTEPRLRIYFLLPLHPQDLLGGADGWNLEPPTIITNFIFPHL